MKIKNLKLFKEVRKVRLNAIYRLYMLSHRNGFYFSEDENVKILEKNAMKG